MSNDERILRLQETYDVIKNNNGISVTLLAEKTGTDYKNVLSRLATMEKFGILLYETDDGLIYPFNDYITK